MLLNSGAVIRTIANCRAAWIGGRVGSCKTSLAYRLAYEFMSDKSYGMRYLLSNCPDVWRDKLSDVQHTEQNTLDCVIVLDEGGQFLDGRLTKSFTAFLRKQNIILLIPSTYPPPRKLQEVSIGSVVNFTSIGLDLIAYKTVVRGIGYRDEFSFQWWKSSEIYGVYDTNAYSGEIDALAIAEFLTDRSKAFARATAGDESYRQFERLVNSGSSVSVQAAPVEIVSPGETLVQVQEEALRQVQEAADSLQEQSQDLSQTYRRRSFRVW